MQNPEYSIDELVHNPSFRRMVEGRASENEINKWDRWIKADDHNRAKAKKAMAEISGFTFSGPDQLDFEAEWNRLHHSINLEEEKVKSKTRSGSRFKWTYRAAAILIFSLCVGLGAYWFNSDISVNKNEQLANKRTLITGPQEQKTVKFSNGSRIVLRRNSTMEYGVDRLHKGTIEVLSLKGEAYFESGAGSAGTAFLVHTPDGIIRDIGTQFLVDIEDQQSKVLLQQGRVRVQSNEGASENYSFELRQRELVTFNDSKIVSRQMVNTTFYTSWATGYLEFDKTSVNQFAKFVEGRFDVDVNIIDSSLSDITLDGAIYFKSLEELVRSVSKVADFPVSQSADDQIVYFGE